MKGASRFLANGKVSTTNQNGLKIEISVNIIIQSKRQAMNIINTVTENDHAANLVTVIGIDLVDQVLRLIFETARSSIEYL
jgi:hypothetical protein